jgi:hypothetical protein
MTVYRLTTAFDRDYYTTYFATLEDAHNYIRAIEYNDVCGLYEVNTTINEKGIITATENRVARPKTIRENKYGWIDKTENYID